MDFLGAELIALRPGHCEIHLPYREELSQQHGFFHAGAIATIADNAAGYAAFSLMDAESGILTVEFKLSLLSPGNGDRLVARGDVIKAGRQLSVSRSDVFVVRDGEEKQCAAALVTLIRFAGRSKQSPST